MINVRTQSGDTLCELHTDEAGYPIVNLRQNHQTISHRRLEIGDTVSILGNRYVVSEIDPGSVVYMKPATTLVAVLNGSRTSMVIWE